MAPRLRRPKLALSLGSDRSAVNGLTQPNLAYAAQLGVTHVVFSDEAGLWLDKAEGFWHEDELRGVRETVEAAGLHIAAIENFPADHWDQILLGREPGRSRQIENLRRTIVNMGRAGIPCMGYCFSLTGAFGRSVTVARGGARSEGWREADGHHLLPLPEGYVWNRWVSDPGRATLPTMRPGPDGVEEHREAVQRHAAAGGRFLPPVSAEEMWARLEWFLRELVPTAEQAGVRLAAHPNDPPLAVHRGVGQTLNTPESYRRLLSAVPSYYNAAEFCQGTVAQMLDGGDFVSETIRDLGSKIAYVHFRNVVGAVPNYNEVFIDEGDVDMVEAMKAYARVGFDGVMQPDHTPAVTLPTAVEAASWHVGTAFAVGYMKAAAYAAGIPFETAEEIREAEAVEQRRRAPGKGASL